MSIEDIYPALRDPEFVESFDFDTCWTANNPGKIGDLDLCVAILRSRGHLTRVGKYLQRSRRQVDRAISDNLEIFYLAADLEDEFLDDIEDTYREIARGGDPRAIQFFLSTKGKERGYSTRAETTGAGGGPVQTEEITARERIASRLAKLASRTTEVVDPGGAE